MNMAWVKDKYVLVASPELRRQAMKNISSEIDHLKRKSTNPFSESRELQQARKALAKVEALGYE